MFSCLQILEAFLWFVLITLLNVTLIILTLSVSRLLNLLLRLVAFLLFLNPQCLASISRWIRSEERFSRNAETDVVCRLLLEKNTDLATAALRVSAANVVPVYGFHVRCVGFFFFNDTATTEIYTLSLHDALPIFLNVTLIILTLSVSRLLNLLLRLVAFLLFLNPQCLASISRWITASSSWKRFCLFVCRALSSIMVICMLTAIRLLLTFVMSLYLLLRS